MRNSQKNASDPARAFEPYRENQRDSGGTSLLPTTGTRNHRTLFVERNQNQVNKDRPGASIGDNSPTSLLDEPPTDSTFVGPAPNTRTVPRTRPLTNRRNTIPLIAYSMYARSVSDDSRWRTEPSWRIRYLVPLWAKRSCRRARARQVHLRDPPGEGIGLQTAGSRRE